MILRYDRAQDGAPAATRRKNTPSRLFALILLLLLPLLLAAEFQTHTVKKGDTLYSLGRTYGVSVDQIKELNGLDSNSIRPNQVLKIKEIAAPAPAPAPRTAPPRSTPPAQTPAPRDTLRENSYSRLDLPDDYYHIVSPKDNLYRIAVNNGIAVNDLLRWNGFADQNHVIHPGDRLIVADPNPFLAQAVEAEDEDEPEEPQIPSPQAPGLPTISAAPDTVVVQKIYVVQKKDNLYRIAKNNGMTVEELKKLNNLTSNTISVGQKLILAGRPPETGTGPRITEAELLKSDRIRDDLIMPTQGQVTSEYGLRNGRPHKGIDIAAKAGTPVYAVLDGVVVYSGIQGGYGNVVVLEHPDFVMTVYAHNEKNTVKVDDRVKQGDLIAYLGSTGQSSGPHLHFEYRLKGKAINPRKVLPLDEAGVSQ